MQGQPENGFYLNGHPSNSNRYEEEGSGSPSQPSKDYISLNKQALRGEVGSAKSYGRNYKHKKEFDQRPPPVPPVRKKKPATTPATASR